MAIRPIEYQTSLPQEILIKKESPGAEAVPLDVLIVGGGPSGLATAIELAKLAKKNQDKSGNIEIGVLEKARGLGEHTLSGAVINPKTLFELFPDKKPEDFPFRGQVKREDVYLMTAGSYWKLPTPPTMHNKGFYIASLSELVRWLGTEAEKLGINILTGFPAESLLTDGTKVLGVRTTAGGLNRQGEKSDRFVAPTDLSAKVTVLAEGTRGPLAQSFYKWKNIKSESPQIFALGVKEIWKVKNPPVGIVHTMGWPLPTDAFGGSFMYPLGENLVALGLVVGLDYKDANLDVHQLLQKLKTHKLFNKYLDGGEIVEWGAKTIPEGGFYAIPDNLTGDGLVVVGDSAGLVNVPALKGIHYSIGSGILAAQTIYEALVKGDVSASGLNSYNQKIRESFICKDLYRVRNMRNAFKSGFWWGAIKAALITLIPSLFPGRSARQHEDAQENKINKGGPAQIVSPSISKVDGVFRSGNVTRDDIPRHLVIGKDVSTEVANFYSHLCPAGVYEQKEGKLVVNAPNCVDCKATDVLGPRWTPREGGSGPRYQKM